MTRSLNAIREHAKRQRDLCLTTGGPHDPLTACWTAILNATNDLDPQLHPKIRSTPRWTQPSLWT